MSRYSLYLLLSMMVFFGTCAQPNSAMSSEPAKQPPAQIEPDPALDKLLEKIESRGKQLSSFQAKMHYEHVQLFIDDIKQQTGTLIYQATDKRVQFRIHFDQVKQWDLTDEAPEKFIGHDEDFAFDGLWLTHRNARLKTLKRWQVAKKAQNREAFRLGKSSFPLPFAVTKKDMTEHFIPELCPADPNDPANTDHLRLTPKKESPYAQEYHYFDLWVSRDQALPVQFRYETQEAEIVISRWTEIRTDQPIADKAFQLKAAGKDWTIEETSLQEEPEKNNSK